MVKKYVGSSENLSRRLRDYLNGNSLIRENCMQICRALLKYGYSNFSLTILEYCEPSKCLEREDYYFQLLKPEYNTAKKPGSPMSGHTHSDESRQIMSDAKIGENNPMYGKPKVVGSGSPSQQIEVLDLKENTTTIYDSISAAARALDIPGHRSIQYSLTTGKAYKKRYTFVRR
jgi:hypothetical protein